MSSGRPLEIVWVKPNNSILDWFARAFARADYRPLREGDVESLQRAGEMVAIAPGAHLFREGEPAVDVYLIEEGDVELVRGSGRARRVIARVGTGSVLGTTQSSEMHPMSLPHGRLAPSGPAVRTLAAAPRAGGEPRDTAPVDVDRHGSARAHPASRRRIALMDKPVLAQVADLLLEES